MNCIPNDRSRLALPDRAKIHRKKWVMLSSEANIEDKCLRNRCLHDHIPDASQRTMLIHCNLFIKI